MYISDLNDGYPRKITWNPFNDKEPVIDNNGKVYFLSDREGGQKLFSFDLNWVGGTIDWQGDWIWESYPEAEMLNCCLMIINGTVFIIYLLQVYT